MEFATIKVRQESSICYIQFNRPESNNTINEVLVQECNRVLDMCEEYTNIIVFEGNTEVFCFGADFNKISEGHANGQNIQKMDSSSLYDLWLRLATGPYITISMVRGKVNAGGIGFVAACDVVIADQTATFSLSELLFGLFPAMVFPFLQRRIGQQKAAYMTFLTKPIGVEQAYHIGLVDEFSEKGTDALRRAILRFRYIPKDGIKQFKQYLSDIGSDLYTYREAAVNANLAIFADPIKLERIHNFVEYGRYPWETLEDK